MAIVQGFGHDHKLAGSPPEDTAPDFIAQAATPPTRPADLVDPVNHEYYGTAGNDSFTAPTGDNWYLSGQAGSDDLNGGAGNDIILGGPGNDFLSGGQGNDSFFVDSAADYVAEAANGGSDRIYASVDYTLYTGQSIEILSTDNNAGTAPIALGGNELDNIIYGNQGDNVLYGKGGNDWLEGLGGNDSYYVDSAGDVVHEAAGGGSDRIYAGADYTLYTGQSIEILATDNNAGTAPIALGGNELDNIIYGNAGDNILYGKGGNDFLGGQGGNDSYYVDSAGDYVQEFAGGGSDRIYAGADYTLYTGQSIEILSTDNNAGTAPIALGGNELDNTIYGNAGNNLLYGKGGNDWLEGLGGDDSYQVDSAGDVVREAAGGGNDRIYASADYTINAGQSIETLSTDNNAGTAAIALTGNELDNIIYGNDGNNILNGGGGNDSILGLGGQNIFAFTTALGPNNVDTLSDFDPALDVIQLGGGAGQPFAAMASGTIGNSSLRTGTAAVDADDYIIYNSATGALFYDDDGNGAHAAVQFATLPTNLLLSAFDFVTSGPANHAPVITSAATAATPENGPPSTIVYQAAATDSDGDRITYSLAGADSGFLSIDAVSGAVRLNNSADFETKSSYSFQVVAADSGVTTAKAVTLTITDVAETVATPIFNETTDDNGGTGQAQAIDRTLFNVSANGDLPNQALPSATIHGSISTSDPNTTNNDVDFYRIELHAGEQIILDVDHTTNSLDTFIRLYGPGGEIVSNDDKISGDPGSNPPFDHNTDSYLTYRVATSGVYYFSIESFGDLDNNGDDDGPNVGESNGNYSLNVSIGPPATAAQIMDEDVDALISGAQWDHNALTYGFPTDTSGYPSGIKETAPTANFAPFTAAQQTATVQLLQLVANVSSLTFQLGAPQGSANIRYAMSDEADPAYAYYPTNAPNSVGGTAWFDKNDFTDPIKGNYAWMGILHETGHTLGLKHGHEAPAVSAGHDSVEYTVMTYRSYVGGDLNGYTNEHFGYPQSLMMLDIAALQRMYGANFNTNSGSSVYSWSPTTGEMSINGVGQGAPGDGGAGSNRVFLTIWDGGGNDTYDMSNYSTNVTVDLRPGEWSILSGIQLASLGDGHTARGNVANALMYQGNTASLIEDAKGGSGGDTLIANQAANHLTGNGGADIFKWMAAGDDGTGALADTIMDFARGSDKIDLSNIDANPATGTLDAFHFIGTAAFSHTAGELRYDVTGGNAHIFADLDGNGVFDMEIIVNGVTTLAGTDFNGVTGSNANLPADFAGSAATDKADVSSVAVPADTQASVVTGRVFDDFGGMANAQVHLAATHDHASLGGMDFYF